MELEPDATQKIGSLRSCATGFNTGNRRTNHETQKGLSNLNFELRLSTPARVMAIIIIIKKKGSQSEVRAIRMR